MAKFGKLWMLALLAAACGSGTPGRAVRFEVELGPSSETPAHFVTKTGWTVDLEQACIAIGPIYLFANPPLLAPAGTSFYRTLSDWLIPSAHAHGGDSHYHGGEVRGEWVDQVAFDPLSKDGMVLGAINGLAGPAQSFSLSLLPPRPSAGGNAACLRGHHAYARGTAKKADHVVPFAGGLDIENKGTYRSVEGLPIEANLDDEVKVTVRLRVSAWFDGAHFDRLTQKDDEGRFVITPESQVGAAWFAGARGYTTFSASATPEGVR